MLTAALKLPKNRKQTRIVITAATTSFSCVVQTTALVGAV
jgi:hypothetical protein